MALKIFGNNLFLAHEFVFQFCQHKRGEFSGGLGNIQSIGIQNREDELVHDNAKNDQSPNLTDILPIEAKYDTMETTKRKPPMPPPLPSFGIPSNSSMAKMTIEPLVVQNLAMEELSSTFGRASISSIAPSRSPSPLHKKSMPPAPPPLPKNAVFKNETLFEDHSSSEQKPPMAIQEMKEAFETPRVSKSFLDWRGMSSSEIKGTIWEDINDLKIESSLNKGSFEGGDFIFIHVALFCINTSLERHSRSSLYRTKSFSDSSLLYVFLSFNIVRPASSILSLIDLRRANNIAIGCSRLHKRFKNAGNLIKELYSNVPKITLDDLFALKPLLPLPQERTIFQLAAEAQKHNNNSPAESFMMAMSLAPALNWIVDAMIMQRQFDSEYSEIIRLVSLLSDALLVLKNSPAVKLLMRNILDSCQLATLEFGRSKSQKQQILMRGATKGFRISTLSRLAEFRSDNGQKSLVHFIAESLDDSFVIELKEVSDVLSGIRGTDSTLLREAVHELKLNIDKIKEGPGVDECDQMMDQFLATINIWTTEKDQKLTDLWDLFQNFDILWEQVAIYFGEEPCALSNVDSASPSPSVQRITLDEFFKQWDDFLKGFLDAHLQLEVEKWNSSSSKRPGGRLNGHSPPLSK